MKKLIALFSMIMAVIFCSADTSGAADTTWLARSWLTKGNGWAERGVVRVEGDDKGSLLFGVSFDAATNAHYIVSLDIKAELNMSRFNIEAWDYSQQTDLTNHPIPIPETAPTVSEPMRITIPAFDTSALRVYSYELVINSASNGTMKLDGEIVEHGIDFSLENVLWQQGTPEPDDPDNESGCNSLSGLSGMAAMLPVIAAAFACLRRKARR